MKKVIKKIFYRLMNYIFKLFLGLSFSEYIAARTNRSFDSMSSVLLWMVHSIKEQYPDFSLRGKDIAEFGSGKFLAHPVGFKVLGANSVTSFDLHRQFNQKAALIAYSQQVMAKKIYSGYATPGEYQKIMDDIKSTYMHLDKLKLQNINYLAPYDLRDYKTSNKFYLVTSYTVLEHVPFEEIFSLLTKSVDILINGGYFCHFIDLEDHLDPENDPFGFLVKCDWNDKDSFSRGNRLRLSDWEKLFCLVEGVDFKIVSILRRNASLLPMNITEMDQTEIENITVSGILVIGKKH